MPAETDFDEQDVAEVLDETNLTPDGDDIANFDDIADVRDFTQLEGDDDEDDEDLDDLDDEDFDEIDDELEGERDDEGLDVEREPLDALPEDENDGVSSDFEQPDDFEA